jgi:predicted nucleic acid-binding protein
MLVRIWELHANLTPYDAAYVALAETIDATLVTADRRLSLAPGPRCTIEYLGS